MKAATRRQEALVEGVGVVMVSYWTGPVLFAAIDRVLAQDRDGVVDLIVVDNGNPPAVTEELVHRAKAEPRLRLVSGHGNIGFARGCNIGGRQAVGRYLLLLNPDCCLGPGAISALLAEASGLGDHWMLGCRVVNPDGSEQRGSRRALLTPYTALVEAFRLDRLAPGLFRRHRLNHHDDPPLSGTVRIPAISGACMMLPTATFHAMGGLDEGYFLHVDDLDLCLRLDRAGIPVYYTTRVEVVHHMSSSRANPVSIEWHKTRGFLRYFWTHFRGPHWVLLWGP
ncbi:MAG: glycosyltransferase family 2 protein, partial [Kiloniellaceae bacterium]